MRKLLSWVSAAGLALGSALPAPATAVAAPACSSDWGAEAEYQAPSMLPHETAHPLSVRAGQDERWDRLVVELGGDFQGYVVGYVDELTGIGSGRPIPSRGDAALATSFEAQGYGELDGTDVRIFYGPHDADEVWDVSGFPAFRQVLWQGSFEGRAAMGLGVREELPFRVLVLDGPDDWTRLVIDVARTPRAGPRRGRSQFGRRSPPGRRRWQVRRLSWRGLRGPVLPTSAPAGGRAQRNMQV